MTRHFQLLCFVLTLLPGGIARADDGGVFRYKSSGKQALIYQTTAKMEQSQAVGGQKAVTRIKQTTVSEWTFESTDSDNNQQWRSETKQLKVRFKIDPVGEYRFDSTSDDPDSGSVLSEALNPVYDRLATAVTIVTISPLGEVKSVGGVTELLADLLKDHPLGARLAGGGNDEAARLNLAEYLIVFSDKPVKPGDSWDVEFDMTLPAIGKITGKRTYGYLGPDKVGDLPTEKFSVVFDISIDVSLKVNETELSGKLSTSDSSGTVQFDAAKGRIVSVTNRYTVAGDINITRSTGTQTIKSSQTQTVEHLLLEKLPESNDERPRNRQ